MNIPIALNPKKYMNLLRHAYFSRKYNLPAVEAAENIKFFNLGLDPYAAIQRLDAALYEIGSKPFDDLNGADSVHWLIFSALSLSDKRENIRRILEIGTFRGKTALLLKILFPAAHITTIDLPITDPIMKTTYRRGSTESLRDYLSVRDQRVRCTGINFIESNSFFTPSIAPGPFDLIWMDGGHLYPEVAWDFCNAWHACRQKGIIMCDDIIPDPCGRDAYASDESFNVINYVAARSNIQPVYFLKRRNPMWSADPRRRKYVAWIEKV